MVAAAGLFSRCDASEEDAGKVQQIAIEEEGKVQQMAKKRSHSRWRRRAGGSNRVLSLGLGLP